LIHHTADKVLHAGTVHTHFDSDASSFVEGMAIKDGVLTALGSLEELEPWIGPDTEVVNLEGRTVLAAFCDSHLHLHKYAQAITLVDCETQDISTALERLKQRSQELPEDEWVLGHGWRLDTWGRFGTREELDHVIPDKPAYITSKSLHAAWVNSRALEQAGISAATPDPPGGKILRDEGGPTGILLEYAIPLISDILPPPSTEQLVQLLANAQAQLHQFGITRVHDFDGPRCFQSLLQLQEQRQLQLRVQKQIKADELEAALALGLRSGFGDDWLRIGQVKFFADGALGPKTAFMLAPYADAPDAYGMETSSYDNLKQKFLDCIQHGLAISIHAIGDAANRNVLRLLSSMRRYDLAQPALPHRIEHLQLLHPEDIPLLQQEHLVYSMQPSHAVSDMDMAEKLWGERCSLAYAWRTVLRQGGTLIFGSDAPVEQPNPLWGIHAAVTRQKFDGTPPGGWHAEQCISRREALHAYTTAPAIASGMGSKVGRLLPSYLADLQIYDQDPLTCEPEALLTLRPAAVMLDGAWILRSF